MLIQTLHKARWKKNEFSSKPKKRKRRKRFLLHSNNSLQSIKERNTISSRYVTAVKCFLCFLVHSISLLLQLPAIHKDFCSWATRPLIKHSSRCGSVQALQKGQMAIIMLRSSIVLIITGGQNKARHVKGSMQLLVNGQNIFIDVCTIKCFIRESVLRAHVTLLQQVSNLDQKEIDFINHLKCSLLVPRGSITASLALRPVNIEFQVTTCRWDSIWRSAISNGTNLQMKLQTIKQDKDQTQQSIKLNAIVVGHANKLREINIRRSNCIIYSLSKWLRAVSRTTSPAKLRNLCKTQEQHNEI